MKNRILYLFVFLLLSFLITISLIKIIVHINDTRLIKNEIDEINNIVKIEIVSDDRNDEITEESEYNSQNNYYWDYVKMNLIDVDLSKLKEINNDVVGWIYIGDTNINYPFVQANDNDFYLNHSFSKKYNSAGWVFLDYRNNIKDYDKNTIIYAHGRLDKTMFGSLSNTLKSKWLNDYNNHIIKLSTEVDNSLWQVFSVYHIPTTNDYTQIHFSNDDEFLHFTNILINRSYYNFNTDVSKNDRILTISTCYSNSEKLVLHAKLIKKETR